MSGDIKQALNLETGKISWPELQRYFAAGRMLVVDGSLDLVEVAALFATDDAPEVAALLEGEQIAPASTAQARDWQETNPEFWAVVVAPWVLTQKISPNRTKCAFAQKSKMPIKPLIK